MTDKEKVIKELKEALDSLDITNKYRLNIIRAIEYLQEEPISEDLEKAAEEYAKATHTNPALIYIVSLDFKAGAQWQKLQMEANRIEHCKNITKEQAKLEDKFVSSHIKKNNRMPTFLDAIEYGMKYGKKQIMKQAVNGIVYLDVDTIPYEKVIKTDAVKDMKHETLIKIIIIK